MKQFVFALVLTGLSFNAMASSTYICKDSSPQPQLMTVNIADDGSIAIPSESNRTQFSGPAQIQPGQTDDCLPHGQNGVLIENGSGPGYWVYRFPQSMVSGASASVKAQLSIDEDSDNHCTHQTLTCDKQ